MLSFPGPVALTPDREPESSQVDSCLPPAEQAPIVANWGTL